MRLAILYGLTTPLHKVEILLEGVINSLSVHDREAIDVGAQRNIVVILESILWKPLHKDRPRAKGLRCIERIFQAFTGYVFVVSPAVEETGSDLGVPAGPTDGLLLGGAEFPCRVARDNPKKKIARSTIMNSLIIAAR